jgi:hypothetical protein
MIIIGNYLARPLNPPQGDFNGIDPSLGEAAKRGHKGE